MLEVKTELLCDESHPWVIQDRICPVVVDYGSEGGEISIRLLLLAGF